MILFGAKYSHTDDAVRAVKCAIKMMELIKSYSRQRLHNKQIELDLSIGINYGLVVTGKVGNRFDIDYTVMGDIVNTAQRLQSNAGKGNILVSEHCYKYTKDWIVYSRPKEIIVKNKKNPVKCYNVIEIINNKEIFTNDLFERENEIKSIKNAFAEVHNKRFINIIGESGIGKTSLVKEFLLQENMQKISQIWVTCSSIYKIKSYYVINNLLSQLIGIIPEDNMYEKKHKLKSYLYYVFHDIQEEVINQNYNILTIIMGIEISEDFNKILKSMEYNDFIREIEFQLKLFFRKLYDIQNYIFVIDDLQWADETSIRLLYKLSHDLVNNKSLYVFSSQTIIEELMYDQNTIYLRCLSREGLRSIVKKEFECNAVDELFLDILVQKTNGNPLYAKEYIAALRRNGQYYYKEEKLSYL